MDDCLTFVQEKLRERKAARLRTAEVDDSNEAVSEKVGVDETFSSEQWSFGETYMLHEDGQSEADMRAAISDTVWNTLYPSLHSLASYLVHTSPLPYWHGQEDDMAEDIVQETVRRVIEWAQQSERGEAPPIQSLKQMATTVAYNYYRDLKRHDYRLSRLDTPDANMILPVCVQSMYALTSICWMLLRIRLIRIFSLICLQARLDSFPPKQKQAILIDLANRMYFDKEPTSLQESFLV